MDTLDIWGNRTWEIIPEALAKFNRGIDKLIIRAISGNVARGMEIAYILSKEFGIGIAKIEMKPFRFEGIQTFRVEIALESATEESPGTDYTLPKTRFVDFPVYHLLLDWWLSEGERLRLFHEDTLLVTIERDGGVRYATNNGGVREALCRCGLLWPANWKAIASKLSEFDDVILGVDTNVLYNCTVSEHLIPALSLMNPRGYAPTPNWILFVIPNGVMHELEEAANLRNDIGYLGVGGRMGFRALQEVIELNQNADLPGISLLVSGDANPILDTRVELQGLRRDLRTSHQGGQRLIKSSSGDMIIRSQFKQFLRQVDFHKGAYFLTADKSNAALARAEGLSPIYIQPPPRAPHRIRESKGQTIDARVPLGKMIYEMAVQFRPLAIRQGDREIEVRCDARGERIEYWLYKSLEFEREDFEELTSAYRGQQDLGKATKVWSKLVSELVELEY